MAQFDITKITGLALMVSAILVAGSGSALADKPSWAGGGQHEKHNKHHKTEKHVKKHEKHHDDEQDNDRDETNSEGEKPSSSGIRYFTAQHRTVIREYYADEYQAGHCPPGLAKKNNGCRPPGQAKKWVIGQPLPRNIIFYTLPPEVLINLGTPPADYRFVRVASDILMISIGAGIIADVLTNLDSDLTQ